MAILETCKKKKNLIKPCVAGLKRSCEKIQASFATLFSGLLSTSNKVYFIIIDIMKAQGLGVLGEEEGSGLCFN